MKQHFTLTVLSFLLISGHAMASDSYALRCMIGDNQGNERQGPIELNCTDNDDGCNGHASFPRNGKKVDLYLSATNLIVEQEAKQVGMLWFENGSLPQYFGLSSSPAEIGVFCKVLSQRAVPSTFQVNFEALTNL
jgi:hypothetical protein